MKMISVNGINETSEEDDNDDTTDGETTLSAANTKVKTFDEQLREKLLMERFRRLRSESDMMDVTRRKIVRICH